MNIFKKLKTFLKEVFLEIKKINWLSRREILKYTAIVVGISLVVASFLGGLDYLFTTILRTFFI